MFNLPTIHTHSLESCWSQGVATTNMNAAASATWPTSNLALFFPIRIFRPYIVTQLFLHNGSAVSGNVDIGVYSSEGDRLVSSGSTAQSGTSVLQTFNVTDTTLAPGRYFLAVAIDNTTATVLRTNVGVRNTRVMGMRRLTSAFALPSSASTWVTSGDGIVPIAGMTNRSFV